MKVLYSELRENVLSAHAKICENVGIPDGRGTDCWSNVFEFENGFFISYPDNGWGGFTAEQMMDGVEGVSVRDVTIIRESEDIL